MKRVFKNPEMTKTKMRQAKLKKPTKFWLGKHLSKEMRIKISKTRRGYRMTEDIKRKIGVSNTGKKHWNWRGGIAFKPYPIDWTKTFRISIREKYRYTCQICGELQENYAFDCHHIDYNKQNCNPDNLIILCRSCHIKTNTNREYWKRYFNNLIK